MLNISFRLTAKKAVVGLFLLLAVFAALFLTGWEKGIDGENDAQRRTYISSLGYTVSEEEPETAEITVPQEFSDVYTQYNELQLQAGFDLKAFKGRQATRYSYFLTDYDAEQYVVANLIVCEGKVIGGDISSRRLDGFMLPLEHKDNGTT